MSCTHAKHTIMLPLTLALRPCTITTLINKASQKISKRENTGNEIRGLIGYKGSIRNGIGGTRELCSETKRRRTESNLRTINEDGNPPPSQRCLATCTYLEGTRTRLDKQRTVESLLSRYENRGFRDPEERAPA